MLKIVRSLYTFYLSHFFLGLTISICCSKAYDIGGPKIISILFWFKVITMAIVFYAINIKKQREYYYYQNLGISKKLLWVVTLGVDFLIFVVSLVSANQLR